MPTYSFSPNQGESSNLTAEDRLRQANADRMIQMTLAQMQDARSGSNAAAQERMFNTNRQDRSVMFNREMDANAAHSQAQERMFGQELGFRKDEGAAGRGFQKEMFTLGEDAANKRFQTNRQATKEDYDYLNPEARLKRDAINKALNASAGGNNYEQLDALGLNYLIPDNEKANLAYSKFKTKRDLEARLAKEQGLPGPEKTKLENEKLTKKQDLITSIREQEGDPQVDSTVAGSQKAQDAIRKLKVASDNQDSDAIADAGFNAYRELTAAGMSPNGARKLISDYATSYKKKVGMTFKDFIKNPITAPFGWSGSGKQSREALDQFIMEGLQ